MIRLIRTVYHTARQGFDRSRLWIFDSLVLAITFASRPRSGSVVVRSDAIGDFVLWLPYGRALCQYLQESHGRVTLICNAIWAEVAAAELDVQVLAVDRIQFQRNLFYRYRIIRRLRQLGTSVVHHPVFSRELVGDNLVRACGGQAFGFEGNLSNQSWLERLISKRLYAQLLPKDDKNLPETMRNAQYLSWALNKKDIKTPLGPVFRSLAQPVAKFPYWVLAPGASWVGKQWPNENWIDLIRRVGQAFPHLQVRLVGSASECELCASILESSGLSGENLAGQTSVLGMIEVIASAMLFVGNDSSGVHIAAAVGVPSVAILGGGHFGRFMPYEEEPDVMRRVPCVLFHKMSCYGCEWRCSQPHDPSAAVPCIASISSEEVWQEVRSLLSENMLRGSSNKALTP